MFGTSFFEPFHVEHVGGAYSCHCSRILRRAAHWGVRPGSSRAQLAVVLAVAQHCRDCCHTVCLPDESLSAAYVDKKMGELCFFSGRALSPSWLLARSSLTPCLKVTAAQAVQPDDMVACNRPSNPGHNEMVHKILITSIFHGRCSWVCVNLLEQHWQELS